MKEIISPVDRELIKKELKNCQFLRKSHNGNTELYVFISKDSPNLLMELGRLRELTFREAGGGTGKSYDVDKYDTAETPYQQLIVWDPDSEEIIGAYRYILGSKVMDNYEEKLATTRLFRFSEEFIRDYLPYTIELGRSFVQPKFQFTNNRKKGMFALDNLWDGIGAVITNYPEMKYFFGKVTMYKHFNKDARNLILSFLHKYFTKPDKLVEAIDPIDFNPDKYLSQFSGNSYQKNYAILSSAVRKYGENIPPLLNAYMNISPSMRCFGTVENPHFGGVEETGIMVNIADIYESKKERYMRPK